MAIDKNVLMEMISCRKAFAQKSAMLVYDSLLRPEARRNTSRTNHRRKTYLNRKNNILISPFLIKKVSHTNNKETQRNAACNTS